MVKCPECNKEIDWLKAYSKTKHKFKVVGNECLTEEISQGDYLMSFECPECDEELFTDEAEATEFLMGEK